MLCIKRRRCENRFLHCLSKNGGLYGQAKRKTEGGAEPRTPGKITVFAKTVSVFGAVVIRIFLCGLWDSVKYKNSLSFTKDIYSVSDRKLRKAEGFDRSKVTKEKFLLRMEADNAAYKGMPVYQDILENIELKKKGKELYYSCNNRYYALNYMFGKPYSSKEDVAHKIWEMSKNGITDKMFLTAIIDDETWELYKKAEYAEE